MKERPISITIISWLFIIGGIGAFAGMVFMYNRPATATASLSEALTPIQLGLALVLSIVKFVCGILILKAKHIGRIVYAASAPLAWLIGAILSGFSMTLIPSLVLISVYIFFLFTPKANKYFSGEGAQQPSPKRTATSRTILNIIGICCFIAAGFFINMMGILSFFAATGPDGDKASFLGIFCIPPLIFYLVGLAFYRGANWKMTTGLILLISGSLCLLTATTILFSKNSMKAVETVSHGFSVTFGDYTSGFTVIALCISVGALLCLLGRSPDKSS
ncbi:hypothetical protein EDC56_0924 [Sinobacterium caligoides]|uniref:Uncharacterized protein n=1 Tax=Sinobacterium caligoides TaxID=933926 RepID=A0A3N2DZY6_9GAMM|nr:hypothetical protein [Sinobacterium caligoides]ROS05394.1 hypothetical protein EDC56_0924 [Sinobacterium caligoides]